MSRYVLATSDDTFEAKMRKVLGLGNGDLRRLGDEFLTIQPMQAVRAVAEGNASPDVVALGPGLNNDQALELAQRFDEMHPEINVVLIAKRTSALMEKALRAGVRDVISPDSSEPEIREALERAGESAARRRANLSSVDNGPRTTKRVIVVISPKGGSGKTTMVTNLAVGLAQVTPGNVVVADLDLQFGDVGSALRLAPDLTMGDADRSFGTLDAMSLKTMLTSHSSGLYVLAAPESPVEGEQVSAAHSAEIVRLLSNEFSHVVVDTSAGLTDHTLSVLDVATDILLVCTMDVSSVRSLHKVVTALDQLGMTSQQRHFVLNRAESKVGLDAHDIEAAVGLSVDVAVPSSRAVPLSMNQGEPVIMSDPKSAVARQLQSLVSRFVEVSAPRSRWFAARKDV